MRRSEEIKAIEEWCRINHGKFSSHQIITCVCMAYGISEDVLKNKRDRKKGAEPRQCATWYMRNLNGLSYTVIANRFGHKKHTGILRYKSRVDDLLDADDSLMTESVLKVYDMLKQLL